MILSMTGYGRGNAVLNGRDITVEIRSVNSRFFEYSSKLPRSCLFLDDKLKKLLSARISRGKTELSLQIQEIAAASTTVEVNMELARSYRQALRSICNELDLKDTTSVEALARFPDVLTVFIVCDRRVFFALAPEIVGGVVPVLDSRLYLVQR